MNRLLPLLILTCLFWTCGGGDKQANESPTPTLAPERQGDSRPPEATSEVEQQALRATATAQVWVDGVVLEATAERTVLQQGNVAMVEISGRPIVFDWESQAWQITSRALRAGERICMSAFVDHNNGLIAGKTFSGAICGDIRLEE
jgi:hypothetical protein